MSAALHASIVRVSRHPHSSRVPSAWPRVISRPCLVASCRIHFFVAVLLVRSEQEDPKDRQEIALLFPRLRPRLADCIAARHTLLPHVVPAVAAVAAAAPGALS
jgi:hypothetical protein